MIFFEKSKFYPLSILTSSSSGSSLHVSVCGTVWPSNRSTSWLCGIAHEPHGSPSSFSSHGGPGGSHAAYGVTQCARSEAIKHKAHVHVYSLIKFKVRTTNHNSAVSMKSSNVDQNTVCLRVKSDIQSVYQSSFMVLHIFY